MGLSSKTIIAKMFYCLILAAGWICFLLQFKEREMMFTFCDFFSGPGCDETQMHQIPYGMAKKHEKGAVYQFECEEGAVLSGSPTVYCDGYKWNDTAPTCLSKYFWKIM